MGSAELVEMNPAGDVPAGFVGRLTTIAFDSLNLRTQLVTGSRRLLALLPEIHRLRTRCGQQADFTTDPEYFIATNTLKNKRVAAVLIRREHELESCLFFFEHCLSGLGLGLVRGGDALGGSFVIGPKEFHLQYVHLAAQCLMRHRRIHGVSLTVKRSPEQCIEVFGPPTDGRVFAQRDLVSTLKLADTYQAMLAGMGSRTRRSLATKRRQLEERASVTFLANLDPAQALDAVSALRLKSWPERISQFYEARHRLLCEHSEMFTMGMCIPDGSWLSVVSGWRRDGVTFIDLQMNDQTFKKESLSAVMRAFLLEHEIGLQQKFIDFVGGCSILLGRYCEQGETCTDIILQRPGLRSTLFKILLPFIKPSSPYERLSADS